MPKLASRLHFEVMMAVNNGIQGILPQLIQQGIEQREASSKHETAFFDRWQELKGEQHKEIVLSSIKAIRMTSPQATPAQVIEAAGQLAMMRAGLVSQAPQQQQTPPSAPPRPAGVGTVPTGVQPNRAAVPRSDIDELVEAEISGALY
jgi:hypothetical protein